MKRVCMLSAVFLMLLFLLCFPSQALDASRDGMKLWLNTLIPTLLPFLILTGIVLRTDGIEKVLSPLAPVWKHVFGLSSAGAYALLLGLLCGYPMGAKISSDLYTHGRIGRREAEYLLTFSNNASPAFLNTYLAHVCLKGQIPLGEITAVLLASNCLCMLFFRFFVFRNRTVTEGSPAGRYSAGQRGKCLRAASAEPPKKETSSVSSLGTVLDVSIMNGFETITRLGGYILLFSILSAGTRCFWNVRSAAGYLALGSLEITTGLHMLAESSLPWRFFYPASMMLTAFGGFCVLAQTRSVMNRELSLRPCFSAKCLNACITGGILLLLI